MDGFERRQTEPLDVNHTRNTKHPIQTIVADQHGLNEASLIACIEENYISVNGKHVKVEVGLGVAVNGCPQGTILIRDRSDVREAQ